MIIFGVKTLIFITFAHQFNKYLRYKEKIYNLLLEFCLHAIKILQNHIRIIII